jgi:rhodanese-related sulfurtransferase
MEELIKNMNLKEVAGMKVTPDQFIELYNSGEAMLLDIRYPFETEVWGMTFSKNIPLNELADRKGELPKDKLIVCICPENFRSEIGALYLKSAGFNAKMLFGGLNELTSRLKGGKAKDIQVRKD